MNLQGEFRQAGSHQDAFFPCASGQEFATSVMRKEQACKRLDAANVDSAENPAKTFASDSGGSTRQFCRGTSTAGLGAAFPKHLPDCVGGANDGQNVHDAEVAQ